MGALVFPVVLMKVNKYGVVLALKNLGIFLAQFSTTQIRLDSSAFLYSLLIYACVSIPTDLFLLNHATSQKTET